MQVQKARQGYKLVKSLFGKYEEIPEEWEYGRLSNLAEKEKDIVAGPFGSNLVVSDYRTEGVPIIRLQNIDRNRFIDKNIQFISKEKAEELKYHSYKPDDLVLAKLGDPIGKTCRIPKNFPAGIVVADVVRIRTSSEKADSNFVEYMLNSIICARQLNKERIGTTRPRVNLEQIRNLEFPTPTKSEQQKIASILSNVDSLIQQTQKIIEQTQKLKKGLMQKLLTGGIGHTKFKKVPYIYKKTVEIPHDWGYEPLSKLIELKNGFAFKSEFFVEQSTMVVITPGNFHKDNRIYFEPRNTTYYDGFIPKGFVLENGDLLIVMTDLTRDAVILGNAVILQSQYTILHNQRIAKVLFKNVINKDYLLYFLNTFFYKLQIKRTSAGTGVIHTSTDRILNCFIPIPSEEEQKRIVKVLSEFDRRLEHLREYKSKLESLKKGLMQKLLTGQMRVKV